MIQVNSISKAYSGQELFSELSFNFPARARVGLVGRNGSGKSTLFKLVIGEENLDTGEIVIPKNYKIGTLKQHIEFSKKTIRDECYQVMTGDAQYETYKVDKILSGLGFSKEDLDNDPLSFSGGYQIRINLAKLLATEPNMLLLDEPTNYLDIVSLRWLRSFLKSFDGEVFIITHDQEFMNSVTTHTMGLHRKRLTLVKGNTEKFYTQLLEQEELHEKSRINHEKKKKEMERFVERFRAKASKATQAQSKLKQLQKMEDKQALAGESNLEFSFNYKKIPSRNLLQAKNLTFGFEKNQKLFSELDLNLQKGECLGIIGKNGKGKSTLLNCLAGELLAEGEIQFHPEINFSHFGQTNISRLREQKTIAEEIAEVAPDLGQSKVRNICGTMMFSGDMADKKVAVLSGGERARVMLGKIIAKPSNLLLLDEPTNHLDMQSIESLAEAIEEFEGGVVIVTHSEMLLRRLVNKLVIFHKGKAELFLGSYEDFLEKIGWEETDGSPKKKPKASKKELQKLKNDLKQARFKALNPLKEQISKLEKEITNNEELVAKANNELILASQENDGNLINSLAKKVSRLNQKIETDFETLAAAQEEFDQIDCEFKEKLNNL